MTKNLMTMDLINYLLLSLTYANILTLQYTMKNKNLLMKNRQMRLIRTMVNPKSYWVNSFKTAMQCLINMSSFLTIFGNKKVLQPYKNRETSTHSPSPDNENVLRPKYKY